MASPFDRLMGFELYNVGAIEVCGEGCEPVATCVGVGCVFLVLTNAYGKEKAVVGAVGAGAVPCFRPFYRVHVSFADG